MIEKIMKFLKENNIGEEYEPWRKEQKMVRKVDDVKFNISIDGVTVYFNNDKRFNAETLIEVCDDSIDFRTKEDFHQTTFVVISFDKIKDAEWRINGEYKYIEE